MVKPAAHDSLDGCSNRPSLNYVIYKRIKKLSPSAGIGRQDNLKIYWYKIVNVQVVFRIKFFNCAKLLYDPFVQWLRQNTFTVKIRVQIPYGLLIKDIYIYLCFADRG